MHADPNTPVLPPVPRLRLHVPGSRFLHARVDPDLRVVAVLEVRGEIRLDPVLQHVVTVMTVEVQARLHVAVGASQLVKPGPRCAHGERVRHDFTVVVLDLGHGRVLEGVVPVTLGRSDLWQNIFVDVVAERLSCHVRLP
ncbi:unnamed protein product, partial [Ectocarpus sp. 12 AP-2014]